VGRCQLNSDVECESDDKSPADAAQKTDQADTAVCSSRNFSEMKNISVIQRRLGTRLEIKLSVMNTFLHWNRDAWLQSIIKSSESGEKCNIREHVYGKSPETKQEVIDSNIGCLTGDMCFSKIIFATALACEGTPEG